LNEGREYILIAITVGFLKEDIENKSGYVAHSYKIKLKG
jgi:hypothetical protein